MFVQAEWPNLIGWTIGNFKKIYLEGEHKGYLILLSVYGRPQFFSWGLYFFGIPLQSNIILKGTNSKIRVGVSNTVAPSHLLVPLWTHMPQWDMAWHITRKLCQIWKNFLSEFVCKSFKRFSTSHLKFCWCEFSLFCKFKNFGYNKWHFLL